MLVQEALARSPGAVWVETDMAHARERSGQLRAVVRQSVEALEVEGLAGFYFEAPRDEETALTLGACLREQVLKETGLVLRMGVAPARFAARMAAEDTEESGIRILDEETLELFLASQPLDRLPGVGPKTAARLAELGARDIPGIRQLGESRLEILLGNHGRGLWLLASGEDPKPLRVRRHPATLSREKSLRESGGEGEVIRTALRALGESLSAALSREGLVASRIALRLTFEGTRTTTRSLSFETPTSGVSELVAAAHGLLSRASLGDEEICKVALILAGLDLKGAEGPQLDLF